MAFSGSLLADRRPRAHRRGVLLMDGLDGLGCNDCDWTSNNEIGGLGALEGCPNTSPTVVLNQDSIPSWILWAVAAWGIAMLLKK